MTPFELYSRVEADHVRIELVGELDIAAAGHVDATLVEIEAERPERIVLDLHKLTFLDSTGLRSLISADRRARENGRRLTLIQGPAAVQRVFAITGLEGRLDIVEDEGQLVSELS